MDCRVDSCGERLGDVAWCYLRRASGRFRVLHSGCALGQWCLWRGMMVGDLFVAEQDVAPTN